MRSRLRAMLQPAAYAIRSPIFAPLSVALIAAALFCVLPSSEAPSAHAMAAPQGVKQRPRAAELDGGVDWFNTDNPVKLADLKGRIVLLDFWTLCCINCIHTLPDLAKLEARYPGILVVIGVHSPKFENEKKSASVFKAILRYDIRHPVINDADRKIWKAYGVDHWPTLVLIDPDGNFWGSAKGEGNLDLVDKNIRDIIKLYGGKGAFKKPPIDFKLSSEKASPLCFPGKVLADPKTKRLFIADSTNNRVVVTDLNGKMLAIAGSGKEGLKDGTFADAQFSDPQGMCLDGETLYVADRKNHVIRALDLSKHTVKIAAGTGVQNRFGKLGTWGAAHKIPLCSPWDLLMHNKRIYIAMSGIHQIWVFDPATSKVAAYAGSGNEDIVDGPLKTANFAQPSGLATDGNRLYVADSEVSAIRSVPLVGVPTGNFVTTVVGEGLFEFGDKNGFGRKNIRLQHALGVQCLNGKLYVADTYNSKIKIIDPLRVTCETYFGDMPGSLDEPGGISIAGGKMYIADTNNHRIQILDMATREATSLHLTGVTPVRRNAFLSTGTK
jgi:DNA-binding beta-propeller fold protein YncE/cytochrome oxidase Cu insertion factor (SCO1/SenC/PrrC family)